MRLLSYMCRSTLLSTLFPYTTLFRSVPLFVIGFLVMSLVRTIGDFTVETSSLAFGFLEATSWQTFYESLSSFGSTYMLDMAMASVGLLTDFSAFKNIGDRKSRRLNSSHVA